MLFRKRERFERTDVPTPGPYTNIIGVAVIVVVAIAVVLTVTNVADRVGKETRLDDNTLGKQVSNQSSMTVTDESYSISQDTFTKILILKTVSADNVKSGTQLQSANILVIREHVAEQSDESDDSEEDSEDEAQDVSTITATLAEIPTDVKVTSGSTSASLSELCSSQGAAACVLPLNSGANVKFSHVIVTTDNVLTAIQGLSGTDSSKLLEDSLDLVLKIRTDMTAKELVSLGDKIAQLGGVDAVVGFTAPTTAEVAQQADGATYETGNQVIDKTSLCISLGTLVPAE